jgi:hypothetical protein
MGIRSGASGKLSSQRQPLFLRIIDSSRNLCRWVDDPTIPLVTIFASPSFFGDLASCALRKSDGSTVSGFIGALWLQRSGAVSQ